jgi:hypothetical protein
VYQVGRASWPSWLWLVHAELRWAQQLRRTCYRCQVCNASRVQLNVHHRTYERRGNESFNDFVVRCSDCHELFHSLGKLASED